MQVIEQLKRLSEESFLTLYQSLENQGFGPLDGEVAKALRFRPHAIKKVPMPQRARKARQILERSSNAELAYELFGTYLLKNRKELVTGFLDATGVAHEEGMIQDIEESSPDVEKLEGTIAELDEKFEPSDVTLYLSMCTEQWPGVPEIEAIWRKRLEANEPAAS